MSASRMHSVLDKGHIVLVRTMPSAADIPIDRAIAQVARASTVHGWQGPKVTGLKDLSEDHKLLKYLWTHQHLSPFEHVTLQFHLKMPMVTKEQWRTHKSWKYFDFEPGLLDDEDFSYNERSGRYQDYDEEFFMPAEWRQQATKNKQASDGLLAPELQEEATQNLAHVIGLGRYYYEYWREKGMAREQARFYLPAFVIYTEFYATTNLRNLLFFCLARDHEGAQKEIIPYARTLKTIVRDVAPWTYELAFGGSA